MVDGRGFKLQGHEGGFLVRPTPFNHVTTDMTTCQEEVFDPVHRIVRSNNFEVAVVLSGDPKQYGMEGLLYYTNTRVVTQCWPDGRAGDSGFIIPTMS